MFDNLNDKIPGSRFFTWAEALFLKSVNAYAIPTEEQKNNIIKQAIALDNIRAHFNSPIIITSWLRPENYNKMIGGAPKSWHKTGLATDFILKGYSCDEVKKEIQAEGLYKGRGEINTTNWIHLDLGGTDWFYA